MKFKKRLAVLLTAAMVMCMTVPAMATEPNLADVPGNGSATGTGESEGHALKEVGKVLLPTISSDAFKYTADPERLVKATNGAKYTARGISFENGSMDNGVFFLVSDNKYDSKTAKFDFENRSSFAIDLTVQVAAPATRGAKDLALVSENGLGDATEAALYLGLDVDGEDKEAVTYGTPAKKTVSINGVDGNFSVSWNGTKYEYKAEENASGWAKKGFRVEGKTTTDKQIEDTTSAPTIQVTWSWKKHGEASALNAVSIDGTTIYAKVLASGTVDSKITSVKVNGEAKAYTSSGGVITIANAAPTAGEYTIEVVYDGETYKGSATK